MGVADFGCVAPWSVSTGPAGGGGLDGINADQYDDAYVFAGNVLAGGGMADWASWTDQHKADALATALANVAAAQLGRAIGALGVQDPSDLMALENWSDLTDKLRGDTIKDQGNLQFDDITVPRVGV